MYSWFCLGFLFFTTTTKNCHPHLIYLWGYKYPTELELLLFEGYWKIQLGLKLILTILLNG